MVNGNHAADDLGLRTSREAAAVCRVALSTFLAKVAPDLTPVRIGRRVFFRLQDIAAWLADQPVGNSAKSTAPEVSSPSDSGSVVVNLSDPRVQAMLKKQRKRREESTRRRLASQAKQQGVSGAGRDHLRSLRLDG
jgi:hypothetical protein